MKYQISNNNKSNRLIQIEVDFDAKSQIKTQVFLPRWRPGRYIFVDYVQFIRDLRFVDDSSKELTFEKVGVSSWQVKNNNRNFRAIYQFYCNELDAGSSWIDAQSLYVNPVNCLMYTKEQEADRCEVNLSLDYDCELIVGQETNGHSFVTQNYDELADSPFFACQDVQHSRFECKGVDFGLTFWGECKPDMEKLKKEFYNYTLEQFETMGDFPVSKYEYLFVITPYAKYHGVEHQSSTVIALGSGYDIMNKKLDDLMGVSSHELYHTWNVKKVRPAEMYPYDFQNENFNRLGYVTEGVTTYYGDLFLKRSGYFDYQGYFNELEITLKRHFDNEGRFNKSVAEASYETWIDGYQKSAPHFKTNIYVEGSLCALMSDLTIRLNTNNSESLDSVMHDLYNQFGKNNKGYTEDDYLNLLRKYGGNSIEGIIENHLYGTRDYEPMLIELFEKFGIELYQEENSSAMHSLFGVQMNDDYRDIVERVSLCSDANDKGLVKGARILSVNNFAVNNRDVDSWVKYFSDQKEIQFLIQKDGQVCEKRLEVVSQKFFPKRKVRLIENPSESQLENLVKWLGPKSKQLL